MVPEGIIGNIAAALRATDAPDTRGTIQIGLLGGLIGGVIIWIYEAVVWVGVQHLMPLAGIPRNATGLVFGKAVQDQLGGVAYLVGTGIHFVFALGWGVAFAFAWPWFRRRGYEATLVAMAFAVVLWIVMHVAIVLVSDNHPNYLDPHHVAFLLHRAARALCEAPLRAWMT